MYTTWLLNSWAVIDALRRPLHRSLPCFKYHWRQMILFKWTIPGLFFFIFVFSIQLIVIVQYKCLPMTGFEPLISGIGNDRSTNWPTTTARQMTFFIKNERDWTDEAKEVSSEKKNLNTIIKLFCHNRWPWQINKLFSGQWLWLNWLSSRFRHHQSVVWIQSFNMPNFYFEDVNRCKVLAFV